ncbi:hypothetical protein MP228_011036 [Amoeboaphelidium protococcarum]|nr:hypothetical protein MP228_011036 [Amoeboaphelidium protococcarum]
MSKLKVALVQMSVGDNVGVNLNKARQVVLDAAQKGCHMVVLPECFNSPYGTKYFPKYAERISDSVNLSDSGPSVNALSQMARDAKVHLIGGSIPEVEPTSGKFYNTCTVYNTSGELIAKHRKLHLFDIDIPGKIRFKESDILAPGNKLTQVELQLPSGNEEKKPQIVKIGLGICYDVRFPEMAMICARQGGCHMMVYPGAFNMTTGPLHWELLMRARALDNQMFVAACSPASVPTDGDDYVAYGHSMVVSPAGQVLDQLDGEEGVLIVELDLDLVQQTRQQIPIYTQRRFDVYPDISNQNQ